MSQLGFKNYISQNINAHEAGIMQYACEDNKNVDKASARVEIASNLLRCDMEFPKIDAMSLSPAPLKNQNNLELQNTSSNLKHLVSRIYGQVKTPKKLE